MRFFQLLIWLLLPQLILAQTGNIAGKLVQNNQPIPYATITLMTPTNQVVGGDLSQENGAFKLQQIPYGQYVIKINALGFEEKLLNNIELSATKSNVALGNIILKETNNTLGEVSVTAERKQMEMAVDKKVFNVDKNTTSVGGSAADVLQNVPSVSVGADGNVSLRGKSNVTLLIDGKPAAMLGGDDGSALQALPAASIENIEIITNPSSKYDAQGMGGIINIITKKNKRVGLNGSVTAGVGTGNKYNGGINLNMRNDKFNVFLNSNIRDSRSYHRGHSERKYLKSNDEYYTFEEGERNFMGWNNSIGVDYNINKVHSISLSENINIMRFGGHSENLAEYKTGHHIDSFMLRANERDGGPNSFTTNLAHKAKWSPKKEWSTSLNYVYNKGSFNNYFDTRYFNYHYGPEYGIVKQIAESRSTNKTLTAQTDYFTNLFTEDDRWEMGLKYIQTDFKTNNDPTIQYPDGTITSDVSLINKFKYTQGVFAAYTSYSNRINKLGYNVGLRAENADYRGQMLTTNGQSFKNNFLNLFPSVFLTYELDKKSNLNLNYSRRTNRPSFHDLMPYIDLSNPLNIRMGNPALEPEFINNIELGYSNKISKSIHFMGSAYAQLTSNLIERYTFFMDDGSAITQPTNLNSGVTYGAEAISQFQFGKNADAMLSLNAFQNIVDATNVDPSMDNSGFGWFGKLNGNIKLPYSFSFQLSGNYESRKINAQSITLARGWIDLGLKKNILKDKASITLNVQDILNTKKRAMEYNLPLYYQYSYHDRESRIANLTFTYNFGKSDMKFFGGKKGNQIKDRDRTKQDDVE